jgi:hypothetical protein
VLDFVGIFDKLEKALAFDSDEINAIVKDMELLNGYFSSRRLQALRRPQPAHGGYYLRYVDHGSRSGRVVW